MLYQEQNTQWKHYINVLKLLEVYNATPLLSLGLLCFYSSLNVFNLSAATKNLRANYTFFNKTKCDLLIKETRTQ